MNCLTCRNPIPNYKKYCNYKCYWEAKKGKVPAHLEEYSHKPKYGEENPFWGKKHKAESLEKMSHAKQGYTPWIAGKKHTEETRKKMSLAGIGRKPWNRGKGKKRDKNGYLVIAVPEHPYKTKSGTVREHRLVMEKHLGRYLNPQEVVHHINGNKTDNRIENLQLFASQKEHFSSQHSTRK